MKTTVILLSRLPQAAYTKSVLMLALILCLTACAGKKRQVDENKIRIIVTSDGEIDDECSLARFLLYTNEWEVEGIVTSSSQYHWHGHNWAGDDWIEPYLEAYAEVYPSLVLHDPDYPSPEYLSSVTFLGNVEAEGEMELITPGSQHIVELLLDESDHRPIWIQAWGGTNTIARALKTIEENHPEKMDYVANKIRFFFIWEQDPTYQSYIRPHWGKYNILTIISDQFWAFAYQWNKIVPREKRSYLEADWMKENILGNHGPLCSLYKAHVSGSHGLAGDRDFNQGDFRSEGDSPAFLHAINTGLGNLEFPGYGGWGGRYVKVRDNTWLDPVPVADYEYPLGRWYSSSAWGRQYMRQQYPENLHLMEAYFKPITHWIEAIQNDFAARADWNVKPYEEANHPPVVKLNHKAECRAKPGSRVQLSAVDSFDPDGDELSFKWWYYKEAGNYRGELQILNAEESEAVLMLPDELPDKTTIHIICEVRDSGSPVLTRYKRVIIKI